MVMQDRSKASAAFNTISYLITFIVAAICLIPFLSIISGSFSDNGSVLRYGYHLIPQRFSTQAYESIFQNPSDLLNGYRVTVFNTLAGTVLGTFLIAMTGFVLSRKSFSCRNGVSFFIYFTSIFGGGVVPWYIVYVRVLHLKDSLAALCIPTLLSPFLIILMRTFMQTNIPEAIEESAKIDGAGYFTIFVKIAMPVCKAALATIALFLAINYWNDWYLSSLFITTPQKYELQFYLYNMVNGAQTLSQLSASSGISLSSENMPTETVKLAVSVLATGPVILFYPFAQKYFVKGITVGAVKG